MEKITKTSSNGIDFIKKFEGFRSDPYIDSAGIATIGYGTTFYPGRKKVTMSDPSVDKEKATEIFKSMLLLFESHVDAFCRDDINQNQFDALVSFAYNVGPTNLKSSTLLKKLNKNPNDPSIKNEFLKWVKSNGKTLKGLVNRRQKEADLYFKQ